MKRFLETFSLRGLIVVAPLNTMCQTSHAISVRDRMVSEFEAPHGRALVMEVVNALRGEGHSDGYVRKIAGQLRQALGATIGQGIAEPITNPENGALLIKDIPTFPPLPKSKGRTATLDRSHDDIVKQ